MQLLETFNTLTEYFDCMKDLPKIAQKVWLKKLFDLNEDQLERLLESAFELPRTASITPGRLRLMAVGAESQISEAWDNVLACLQSGDIFSLNPLAYSVCKEMRLIDRWRYVESWEHGNLQKQFSELAKAYLSGDKEMRSLPVRPALPNGEDKVMSIEDFKVKKAAFLKEQSAKKEALKMEKIRSILDVIGGDK